jgi:hypothetical protein
LIKQEKTAKVIRMISVPPVLTTALIVILAFLKNEYFHNVAEVLFSIVFLGLLPILAYPFQKIIPKFRDKGRDGQRKLAFIFTLIGYSMSFVWAFFTKVNKELLLICSTYFLSVILLTICNKVIHFKASGHACSFTGPQIFLIYFIGWEVTLPCVAIAALIIWSSLLLKRHTKSELAGGITVCLVSFVISFMVIL